jgi:acylphosphatase
MVVRLTVSGRVQGVWFRASTRDEALRLGLCGSVRNLDSGAVEIIAAGSEGDIEQLILWARRGPPMAKVTDVQVELLPNDSVLQGFKVIH